MSNLDLVFGALADGTRRAMLARLGEGETTVNALVALTRHKQPTVSKHLKVLERAGLVMRTPKAQYRMVQLNPVPLQEAELWIKRYASLYTDSFDRLDHLLQDERQNSPIEEQL
ncbi:MAG: winged helix-turn-helix transcriptional regulator [Armatimonadetes bacterium]|nr:winged helix-turn-helix transcriptional regulator [Armatimonadota bacterium]